MFELRDRTKNLKKHSPDRGRRINALIENDKIDASRFKLLRERNEILQRSTEPIKLGYDKLITRPTHQQRLVEFWTTCKFPARLIDQHLG